MRTHTAIIIVILFLLVPGLSPAADSARVIVRENAIREQCRFFAPVKAKIRYNDLLTILSKSGDWYKVSFKGVKGCVHKSAIEEKSFKLGGGFASGGGPSKDEVSLAGKGFNPQVEASYKGSHPDLDFRSVDAIEHYQVGSDALTEFLKNGGLSEP